MAIVASASMIVLVEINTRDFSLFKRLIMIIMALIIGSTMVFSSISFVLTGSPLGGV